MTELEKMKSNIPYNALDSEILELQNHASELQYKFNMSSSEDERKEIIKELFGECGDDISIAPGFRCDFGFNIHAKGFILVNYNCVFLDTSVITIGANTLIGPGTCIVCAGHPIHPDERLVNVCSQPINIGENVWIGANCTIMGGVTIGKGSVIGGGSVVTKNIPENVIAVGNPCKVVRKITDDDRIMVKNTET